MNDFFYELKFMMKHFNTKSKILTNSSNKISLKNLFKVNGIYCLGRNQKSRWNVNKFTLKGGFYVPQASMISLACFKAVKYESILAVQPVQYM
jgi:hypothetical protein